MLGYSLAQACADRKNVLTMLVILHGSREHLLLAAQEDDSGVSGFHSRSEFFMNPRCHQLQENSGASRQSEETGTERGKGTAFL